MMIIYATINKTNMCTIEINIKFIYRHKGGSCTYWRFIGVTQLLSLAENIFKEVYHIIRFQGWRKHKSSFFVYTIDSSANINIVSTHAGELYWFAAYLTSSISPCMLSQVIRTYVASSLQKNRIYRGEKHIYFCVLTTIRSLGELF